jgi:hypothetical protein
MARKEFFPIQITRLEYSAKTSGDGSKLSFQNQPE